MSGEQDLTQLLRSLKPILQPGEYVFCTCPDITKIPENEILCFMRESEGITVVLPKETADRQKLKYDYIASWISLTVHSSLHAVGLTAAFSRALADAEISCNVIAGYYHDHIFVAKEQAARAMMVLEQLSN